MVDADAVRRVGLDLPRTYEAFIGRRWKLKVRQLVYVAFSRDETAMGFGYPKDARDSLVASDPETFLPPTSDLRYQWVCATSRGSTKPRRSSWSPTPGACGCRRCSRPARSAGPGRRRVVGDGRKRWDDLTPMLHPYLHWKDRHGDRGRSRVLDHLRGSPTPRPPADVETRDGQVYRWTA